MRAPASPPPHRSGGAPNGSLLANLAAGSRSRLGLRAGPLRGTGRDGGPLPPRNRAGKHVLKGRAWIKKLIENRLKVKFSNRKAKEKDKEYLHG
jgi:hypothetical protein